jgi:hypothetical protein
MDAMGTAHLAKEQRQLLITISYFLEERNWSDLNCGKNETMPYAVCPKFEAVVGDVGSHEAHDREYRDEDTIQGSDDNYPAKVSHR